MGAEPRKSKKISVKLKEFPKNRTKKELRKRLAKKRGFGDACVPGGVWGGAPQV